MAKYRYTEAEAKAFMWGVKQSGAPEMYKALKVAESWCKERLSDDHVDMEMIHLALVKAEEK